MDNQGRLWLMTTPRHGGYKNHPRLHRGGVATVVQAQLGLQVQLFGMPLQLLQEAVESWSICWLIWLDLIIPDWFDGSMIQNGSMVCLMLFHEHRKLVVTCCNKRVATFVHCATGCVDVWLMYLIAHPVDICWWLIVTTVINHKTIKPCCCNSTNSPNFRAEGQRITER